MASCYSMVFYEVLVVFISNNSYLPDPPLWVEVCIIITTMVGVVVIAAIIGAASAAVMSMQVHLGQYT